jgi:hypothetical protein
MVTGADAIDAEARASKTSLRRLGSAAHAKGSKWPTMMAG